MQTALISSLDSLPYSITIYLDIEDKIIQDSLLKMEGSLDILKVVFCRNMLILYFIFLSSINLKLCIK